MENLQKSPKYNGEGKPLTSASIYLFSSLFENKKTFPGIILNAKELQDSDRLYTELKEAGYLENETLTKSGKELMEALLNMQDSEYALIINELAYFFDAKSIATTKVITMDNKHLINYRYKTTDIVAALSSIECLKSDMKDKKERIIKQTVLAKDALEEYIDNKTFAIQILYKGEFIYNKVIIEGENSAIVFDASENTLEEVRGRSIVQEILKTIQIGVEFDLASYQNEENTEIGF